MEKEDILSRFEEKGFNEETIGYLLSAIDEFEMILGKYVSTEEVVERVCRNLDSNILFEKIEDSRSGEYSSRKKRIRIDADKNEADKKTIFFHEFLHCITLKTIEDGNEINGFFGKRSRLTSSTDNEESQEFEEDGFDIFLEDDELNEWIDKISEYDPYEGVGLNEGIISYLTNERNKLTGEPICYSYYFLNQQIENLIQIIPEEELFDCLFNKPETVKNLFEKYNLDYNRVIKVLDSIYQKNKGCLNKFKEVIFGETFEEKTNLINVFLESFKEIQDIETFEKKVRFFKSLEEQFDYSFDIYEIYSKLIYDIENLKKCNVSQEQIQKIIEENNLAENIRLARTGMELLKKDKTDMAISLWNLSQKEWKDYCWMDLYLKENIENTLFLKPVEKTDLYFVLSAGRFLKEHPEIDFDEIEISRIEYSEDPEYEADTEYAYVLKTPSGKTAIFGNYGDDEYEEGEDGNFILKKDENKTIEFKIKDNEILVSVDGEEFKEICDCVTQKSNLNYLKEETFDIEKKIKKVEKDMERISDDREMYSEYFKICAMTFSKRDRLKRYNSMLQEMEKRIGDRKSRVLQSMIEEDTVLTEKVKKAEDLEIEFKKEEKRKNPNSVRNVNDE